VFENTSLKFIRWDVVITQKTRTLNKIKAEIKIRIKGLVSKRICWKRNGMCGIPG